MAYQYGFTEFRITSVENTEPDPTRDPWSLRLNNPLNLVGAWTYAPNETGAYTTFENGIFTSGVPGEEVEYVSYIGVQDNIRFGLSRVRTGIWDGKTNEQNNDPIPDDAFIQSIHLRSREWISAWELVKQRNGPESLLAYPYPDGLGAWGPYGAKSNINEFMAKPWDEDLFYLRNSLPRYLDEDGNPLRNSHWRLEIIKTGSPTITLQSDPRSCTPGGDRPYWPANYPPYADINGSAAAAPLFFHTFAGQISPAASPTIETSLIRQAYGDGYWLQGSSLESATALKIQPRILFGWHCHEKSIEIVWRIYAIDMTVNWISPAKRFFASAATTAPNTTFHPTSVPWTNPARALTDNNDNAQAQHLWATGEVVSTDWLKFGGFDFSSMPASYTPKLLYFAVRCTVTEQTEAVSWGFPDPFRSRFVDAGNRVFTYSSWKWETDLAEGSSVGRVVAFEPHGSSDNSQWNAWLTGTDAPTQAQLEDPTFRIKISFDGIGLTGSQASIYLWAGQLIVFYDDGEVPIPPGGTRHKPFSVAYGTWGNIAGADNEEVKLFSMDG